MCIRDRSILLTLLLIIVGFVIYLTAAEFKPEPVETLEIGGQAQKTLQAGDSLRVLSYNIGYGSLDKTQDFFMDGGKTTVGTHAQLMETVPLYRQLYESQTVQKEGDLDEE